jgi:hypothetical protein
METENTIPTSTIPSAKAWKPISMMDAAEKREYARLRSEASRKKKKQAEELAEEAKRLEEKALRTTSWDSYNKQQLEEYIKDPPRTWMEDINAQAEALDTKIVEEAHADPQVARADIEAVEIVITMGYGIPKGYIDANPAGLFAGMHFVDLAMTQAIDYTNSPRPGAIPRYDCPLKDSPSYMAAYKAALDQALRLCNKYPQLTEKHLVQKIQAEWALICEKEFSL